jgi:hypothetical protein
MKKLIFSFLILFIFSSLVFSQGQSPVPDEIKKMEKYVGTFNGEGTFSFMGQTMKMSGTNTISMIANGRGLMIIENMEMKGMDNYIATDIMGVDPGTNKIHIYSVSNYGDAHDHVSTVVNDKSTEYLYEGVMEGKKYIEKIKFTSLNDTEYEINVKSSLDGKDMQDMTIKFTKK